MSGNSELLIGRWRQYRIDLVDAIRSPEQCDEVWEFTPTHLFQHTAGTILRQRYHVEPDRSPPVVRLNGGGGFQRFYMIFEVSADELKIARRGAGDPPLTAFEIAGDKRTSVHWFKRVAGSTEDAGERYRKNRRVEFERGGRGRDGDEDD